MKTFAQTLLMAMIAALSVTLNGPVLADEECDRAGSRLLASVAERPDELLTLLAGAIAGNESCACELVKSAIGAAGNGKSTVGDIVFTAVSVAPQMATSIVECAVAAAPKAVSEIRAALKSALSDKGASPTSGKEVYGKNPRQIEPNEGFEFGRPPIDARGIYLVDPSLSKNSIPGNDDGDYDFGGSPRDMRGIYLVYPSSGGRGQAAQREEVRRIIERVTTIVRTVRRPGTPGGGTPGGGGGGAVTPSDPVFVRETVRRTVSVPASAPAEPNAGSQPSAGTESVLSFSAASKSQGKASGGSGSNIVGSFELNPAQQEHVRVKAQKELDRLVEKELESMNEAGKAVTVRKATPRRTAPVEQKRVEVKKAETQRKIEVVREKAAERRAAATSPTKIDEIDAQEGREIYNLEKEVAKTVEAAEPTESVQPGVEFADPYSIAVQRVREKYGPSIAVPIESPDGGPAVAFATIAPTGIIEVAQTAYELNREPVIIAAASVDANITSVEGETHILASDL